MKLTITVPYSTYWEEVEVDLLFGLAPHLADVATFGVHRGAREDASWWIVCNLETGMRITNSAVKAYAIREAKRRLSLVCKEELLSAYRKAKSFYPQIRDA